MTLESGLQPKTLGTKTHCGSCGRRLRKQETIVATNMPPVVTWLGHAVTCGLNQSAYGPTATLEQIKRATA